MGCCIPAIQRLCNFPRDRCSIRSSTSFQRKGNDIWRGNETFCRDGVEAGGGDQGKGKKSSKALTEIRLLDFYLSIVCVQHDVSSCCLSIPSR